MELWFTIGWALEFGGIIILILNSLNMSKWIFDHWMKSLPSDFEELKKKTSRNSNIWTSIGFLIFAIGMALQLTSR